MQTQRVIIIGSGLAAGMLIRQLPKDIAIWQFSPAHHSLSSSYKAKGGIAIPLDEKDFDSHTKDTLVAGSFHNKEQVIRELLQASLPAIDYWKSLGFNPDPHKALEGGHSLPRVVHIGDETGKHLTEIVYQEIASLKNLSRFDGYRLIDLIMNEGVANGVVVLQESSGKIYKIFGHAVILATGGGAALYGFHSNSANSTGESLAIASRMGALIDDIEFVQFHPTLFKGLHSKSGQLITEALRGAGAELLNQDLNPFMKSRHPMGSLAPRDLVSQGIFHEMRNSQKDFVWLDISKVPKQNWVSHFPALYEWFKEDGFLAMGRVPVAPGAHYFCGGIRTTTLGEANLPGLFALGETASTGLHGANRLASNSLMEIVSTTYLLAKNWSKYKSRVDTLPANQFVGNIERNRRTNETDKYIGDILRKLVGIVRSPAGLQNAAEAIGSLEQEMAHSEIKCDGSVYSPLANRIQTAKLLIEAALRRKKSLGCHFLESDNQLHSSVSNTTKSEDLIQG